MVASLIMVDSKIQDGDQAQKIKILACRLLLIL